MRTPPNPAARQSMTHVRLCRHADYQRAYAVSRKRQSASMSWFISPHALQVQNTKAPTALALALAPEGPRVGLTVGKVLGKAHDRNRIKRRMREALRRHVAELPAGCDLILHPRRAVLTIEFAKLEAELVRILTQARAESVRMRAEAQKDAPGA